jgi:hypothetical protein
MSPFINSVLMSASCCLAMVLVGATHFPSLQLGSRYLKQRSQPQRPIAN